jgi:hypothetical protein
MNITATDLHAYVEGEAAKSSLPLREVKAEIAFSLEIGVSTLYLWLKSGNYYIEHIESSMGGDDSALIVWKMEKLLT